MPQLRLTDLSFPAATVDQMQLTATIRTRPAEGAKNVDGLAMDVITETADDYDTALAQLDARVPDGWQKLSVRTH
jgi:hypothetical protein